MVVLVSAVYLNFLGSVAYICSTLEYDGLLSYKRYVVRRNIEQ